MGAEVATIETTAVSQYSDRRELEQARFMPIMSIETAVLRRNTIVTAVAKLMRDGQDFGTIPGTPKPTLYQPGADKLNNLFGLVPKFLVTEKHEDWTGERHGGEPFFAYTVTCQLIRGDFLMGEGAGSCNSWESKYRWRKSERVCPLCGKDSIIKGKPEYGGGWLCYAKKGGCGAKFKAGDSAIEEQSTGRVANPDIFDMVNTVLKMANKRAKIAATLNATSAHEFFTQDIEDLPTLQHDPAPTVTQQQVAESKIAQMQQGVPYARTTPVPLVIPAEQQVPDVPPGFPSDLPPAPIEVETAEASIKARLAQFAKIRAALGDPEYYRVLGLHGRENANELRNLSEARAVYREMQEALSYQQTRGAV